MVECRTQEIGREEEPIRFELHARLYCDSSHFFLNATCDIYENEIRAHSKEWSTTIPRDCV